MAVKWFFEQGGKSYGPFLSGQLKKMAATGKIHLEDTVWKEGLDKRVPASRVRYLFEAAHRVAVAAADAQVLPAPELARPPTQRPPPMSASAEAEAAAPADSSVAGVDPLDFPDDAGLVPLDDTKIPSSYDEAPEEAPAVQPQAKKSPDPRREEPEARKKRVISVKGGVLMGQDGERAKVRKKCTRCSHEDTSISSLSIPKGSMRMNFYCPKCRKNSIVEIFGAG
jgi:hypothetical protein